MTEYTTCIRCRGHGNVLRSGGYSDCFLCHGTGRIAKIEPISDEEYIEFKKKVDVYLERLRKQREDQRKKC
jgi:DnaJ-class molecular chaperone